MDVVYTFGHSVDVDGDEWIDLGPVPTACDGEFMTAPPTASLGTGVADRDNPLTIGETEPRAPIAEPDAEPAPSITTASLKSGFQGKPEKGAGDVKRPRLLDHAPVLVSKSKAARSKEALMAFYLGRAKQMEAKHKEKVVSPTQLAFGE
ncbi:hypothetical protein GN244_ATG09117 [Phytophthora infestans]|uniref:Uncharacterized protein n=1 Tax=Phytophthora infestans TaxID=4787 RepID=A0A833WV81_PHYIN|nr:hypothetical protein GN244_ATG09117 [Phytophthora infestans]KAF4147954.1 hypothetical protein GN958_ATG02858 [Phytophthora infestans]KAI9988639.1 hypothetical protein PInf_022089 [Phytophthora infestans]